MADAAGQHAPVDEPGSAPPSDGRAGTGEPPHFDFPTDLVPPESRGALMRYRRAAPWIIGVFGLMGAVVLLAVPFSALSVVEPASRQTIVMASILAFAGVAVAIVTSALALAPRSALTEPVVARRSRYGRYFSARLAVGDALARHVESGGATVPPEVSRELLRLEKDRTAVRMGFIGVMVGAITLGTAMGIMLWEFEDPTTPFEIDRIATDTIRIEADAERLRAEAQRIEAEIEQMETDALLSEAELAVQARRLELELELLLANIENAKADTIRLELEAEAAPLIEVLVAQMADLELSVESIQDQLSGLEDEIADLEPMFAG